MICCFAAVAAAEPVCSAMAKLQHPSERTLLHDGASIPMSVLAVVLFAAAAPAASSCRGAGSAVRNACSKAASPVVRQSSAAAHKSSSAQLVSPYSPVLTPAGLVKIAS